MQEIELKFQIPAQALEAVQAELARLDAGQHAPLPLRAAYFDTAERHLAGAHMALRVRQEGVDWVQTLKAGGSNTMMRLEDNQPACAPETGQPVLADLSRHLGTPGEAPLRRVLKWLPEQDPTGRDTGLRELYRTDITRTRTRVTVGQGTLFEGEVELALDLGHIQAGDFSVPVRELEIEAVSGHPMAVITAGRDWVQRHGLWLDTQTKAHRGDRLARQAESAARLEVAADTASAPEYVTLGRPARIKDGATLDEAWRAGLESCLEHITSNMSELGTRPDQIELTAYQWRLGMRRLRALSRLLTKAGLPFPHDAADRAGELSRLLGTWRDAQALAWIPAKVVALGGPDLPLPRPDDAQTLRDEDVVALARSAQATELCLDLLAALLSPPSEARDAQGDADKWLTRRLDFWQKRCAHAAKAAHKLSDDDLHDLRKRLKRLRLSAALFAPLWKDKRQRRHDRVLKKALDMLGNIQDETVAASWYGQAAEHDARALFVQRWLKGRRRGLRKRAERALQRWLKIKTPW